MTRLNIGMRQPRARRAATVVTFLFVLPVVLAALWFGTPGALAVALTGALAF